MGTSFLNPTLKSKTKILIILTMEISSAIHCKPFYVNVILRNKEEVVANAVAEKTGINKYGLIGHLAGFAANQLVTDESVIKGLSEQLIEGVHKAVTEIGIKAIFKKRYQFGSYVVIRVHVTEVDKLTLILASKGENFAHYFSTLLVAVQQMGLKETVDKQIDHKIVAAIDEAMKRKIGELIPIKLAEKGVEVDCETRFAEDQADFFFDMLERLGIMKEDEDENEESADEGRQEADSSSGDEDFY